MASAQAQEKSGIEAILAIMGTADIEDADQYEVERLSSLLDRPVRLNHATSSRLISSGLFSQYQIASILDYRRKHGDIMSFAELALVDGFNEGFVHLVKHFVELSSGGISSAVPERARQELRLRSGIRPGEEDLWNYAVKYDIEGPSAYSGGFSISRSGSATSALPNSFSANMEYESEGLPIKVIAGDYNARFGQGLAIWNGMSMSSLTSPSTFLRRASSYSRSSSFTGNYAFTGMAASICLDKVVLNASVAFPGLKSARLSPDKVSILPIVNVTWNQRYGQLGVTHYLDFRNEINDMKTSFDMAWCIKGTDIFTEIAYDWKERIPAGLVGATVPLGESYRGAAMLRVYPAGYGSERSGAQRSTTKCSNEYSMTLAAEYLSSDRSQTGSLSVDLAYFPEAKSNDTNEDYQIKAQALWQLTSDGISMKVRMTERIRSWGQKNRTDLRTDITVPIGLQALNFRSHLLHCKSLAALFYAEASYVKESCAAYMRAGIFRADNWDDRIYVYERDAPGGFNVPAMYGRGLWGSTTLSWKLTGAFKVFCRASYTAYPFMEKKKPGKAELKLQVVISF